MMSERRFRIVHLRGLSSCDIQDTAQEILTFYNDLTYNFGSAKQICDLLNELSEENEQLRKQLDDVDNESIAYEEKIEKLEKENKYLKAQLK